MARRPWLDPLARRLLIASGQIKPPPRPVATTGEGEALEQAQAGAHAEAVEKDLLALRLAQDPALPLRDADEVRRAAALGWRLDVNRATAADWRRLPGCRPEQVDLLLRLQRGGVQLSGPEDLGELLQLDSATLQCWLPLLSFSWYGTPAGAPASAPVPVNQASAAELGQLPELTADRCARLLRERSRSPFRDLADLRDRLSLPPAIAERWIGRVSFAPGPAGPSLPRSGPSLPPAGDRSSRRRP